MSTLCTRFGHLQIAIRTEGNSLSSNSNCLAHTFLGKIFCPGQLGISGEPAWGGADLPGGRTCPTLPQAVSTPAHHQFGRNVDFTLGFNLLLVYGKFPDGIIEVSVP